jgi:hypothetical protein
MAEMTIQPIDDWLTLMQYSSYLYYSHIPIILMYTKVGEVKRDRKIISIRPYD